MKFLLIFYSLLLSVQASAISEDISQGVVDTKSNTDEPVLCNICFDEIAPGQLRGTSNTPCKHSDFHEECMQNWKRISKKDVCPYCNSRPQMDDEENIYTPRWNNALFDDTSVDNSGKFFWNITAAFIMAAVAIALNTRE
jgi:hypothetical protein